MTDPKLILFGNPSGYLKAVMIFEKGDWKGKPNGHLIGYRAGDMDFTLIVNKSSISIFCYKEDSNADS